MKAHLCIPLLEENQGEKNTQMMTKLSSKSDSLVEFSMRIQRIKPTTYNKFLVTSHQFSENMDFQKDCYRNNLVSYFVSFKIHNLGKHCFL